MRLAVLIILFSTLFLLSPAGAYAYIGPGAGFAFISSFFILFSTLILAAFILLLWPLRRLIRVFRIKKPTGKLQAARVVVLGLDGIDPALSREYMKQGLMPNMSKLEEQGGFSPLQTTYPSMSPVAWSSFATGVPPSHHNIFDFLTTDLRNVPGSEPTLEIREYRWKAQNGRIEPKVHHTERTIILDFGRLFASHGMYQAPPEPEPQPRAGGE